MDRKDIITKAEEYVRKLFEVHQNDILVYHNIEHTVKVVEATRQISDYYPLNALEVQSVQVSAWFHDVGYLFVLCNDHEKKSAEVAIDFLEGENADAELIEKVRESILATKIFSTPDSITAKILADADLFNLGTTDFKETNKKMWVELKRCYGKKIPAQEWYESALELLEKHQYHTEYCRNLLQKGKQKNIEFLKDWLNKT